MPTTETPSNFQKLVVITNRVAAKFNGSRSTCVLTSFALRDVLRRLGLARAPCVSRLPSSLTTGSSVGQFSAAGANQGTGAPRPPACGGDTWRCSSKTSGFSILRLIRQTNENGRDQCASARSQSDFRKTSG